MGKLAKRISVGALLLVFMLATTAFGQTEILLNGDFESWDDLNTPTGWTKVENIDKDSIEVHGGTYSAKHTGGTKDLGQYVTVQGGYTYDISIWYKTDGNVRIWSYWRSGGANLTDNEAELRPTTYFDVNGSAWTEYSVTLEAPETADELYFELRTYSGVTVYWDDISITETAPTSRTYYIGAAGTAPEGADPDYATIKEAFDSLMSAGVDADITYYITSDITEPANLYLAVNTNDYSVTLKPYTGITPTVTYSQAGDNAGSSGRFIIGRGNESDAEHVPTHNVTIDGSNTEDGTTRDLTFVSGAGTYDYYFRVRGDCDNVTIKNCIMTGITTSYAIVLNPIADTAPDDLTVENCYISTLNLSTGTGFRIAGESSQSVSMNNLVIKDNDILARQRGIFFNGKTKDAVIEGNTFEMIEAPNGYLSAALFGYNQDAEGTTYVIGNNFKTIETTNTYGGAYGMRTIQASGGGDWFVANNVFSGFSISASATAAQELFGIRCGNHVEAYYNTFILNDVDGTGALYRAINVAAGEPIIKNNIFVVEEPDFAAHAISGTPAESDYNNFYLASGAAEVNPLYATLADWQAAGMDPNSVSKAVEFVADDFHLDGASVGDFDLAARPIDGITDDIDGDTRSTMFPYMGADEAATELVPTDNDLELTFDNDGDLVNWTTTGAASTSRIWEADSTLLLRDGGYSFLVKRPVKAFVGGLYKLSLDVRTSLWEGAGNNCDVSVEGLGNDQVTVSVINDTTEWKTVTVIGIADAEDGYIKIEGYKAGTVDSVWVDNIVWDERYKELFPSETVADARLVPDGDDVACIGVVTATTIGSPQFMQDETAGIAVHDSYLLGELEEGDEVLIIGESDEYNGLIEIKYPIEFQILSKGNVVEPILITVPDLDSRDYQGMLVMVEDVDTTDGFIWPDSGRYQNNTLTDGTNTFTMRIENESAMPGGNPPESWPLDLVGVVGEFYSPQILPRYIEDFITNQAPNAFTILNPADEAVFTSFEDTGIVKIEMDGDSVNAMFVNWTDADDPEGDSLVYEMHFIGDGPDEAMMTADTFMFIPLDEEEPYSMNGTYTYYFTATDPMGEVANSDTHTVSFAFPAPPQVVSSDIVLIDGTPTYYIQYDLPVAPALADYKLVDHSDGSTLDPTAIDGMIDYVLVSADMDEDGWYSLVSINVEAAADSLNESPVTRIDTTRAHKAYIPFSANHPEDAGLLIEGFEESTLTHFDKTIFYSSTTGLLTTSTFATSDEEAYEGTMSGKYTLLDDPSADGGWFVRHYIKYPYSETVSANSTLLLMVKGSGNVEIALTVKDDEGTSAGYLRTEWKPVTLCEDDWQVVSFDISNDEVEKWITGDGLLEGETVTLCDLHMQNASDEDAVIYIDGFTERKVLSPIDITLNVMMDEWLRLGQFNLAMDYVDVSGTFNDWPGSGVSPSILSDFDGDTTYSITLPMMPFSTQYFKFRINGSWDNDKHEFPNDGPARELKVPGTVSSFTYWFNNDTLQTAVDGIPAEFALHQNYPNPFNPTTTINFDLPEAADVKLVIYDITGRKVRTLVNETSAAAGYKMIIWNGRDDFGNGVSTGMYIYRLVAGDFIDVKKMTFLK